MIGMGGIDSWESALEFILAGAHAIAVGTAFFTNLGVVREINRGLINYMRKEHLTDISELVGAAWRRK